MAKFRYQGRDREGRPMGGILGADSVEAVASQLIAKGITPVSIQPEKEIGGAFKSMNITLFKSKPKFSELIMFCRQMFVLLKAGVPLIDALSQLRDIVRSELFKEALEGIINSISSGMTITLSLGKYKNIFPPIFFSIIEAGEKSGRLDEAFRQLAEYLEFEHKMRQQFKSALRYPVLVFVAIFVAMFVINFFVVPAFSKMLSSFNIALPLPTRILMGTSEFFIHQWGYIVAAICLFIFLFRTMMKSKTGRLTWDRSVLRIPVFGGIFNRIALSRFVRSFGLIMQAGIPIIEGIKFIANSTSNTYIKAGIYKIAEKIERGESFARAAQESRLFDNLALQMISVGEQSGRVDSMLIEIAQFYDSEIEYDLKRLNDLIEPFILLILGALVLVLALGVFMPIWSMAKIAG